MKKRVINLLVLTSVACLLVLNVVVLKDGNATNLKWGVLDLVYASGSGSGSAPTTWEDDDTDDCVICDGVWRENWWGNQYCDGETSTGYTNPCKTVTSPASCCSSSSSDPCPATSTYSGC